MMLFEQNGENLLLGNWHLGLFQRFFKKVWTFFLIQENAMEVLNSVDLRVFLLPTGNQYLGNKSWKIIFCETSGSCGEN